MRPDSGEDGWFSLARGDLGGGCHTCWVGGGGADEKARIERMCTSLPYVETFNSKVIKSFVPELRSRYVFFEFRDSYVLSLWTFDVLFTHSHIMAMVQCLFKTTYIILVSCSHEAFFPFVLLEVQRVRCFDTVTTQSTAVLQSRFIMSSYKRNCETK